MSLQGSKAQFTELVFCIILRKDKKKAPFVKRKGLFFMKLSRKG